ncbi:hypothetical protein [Tautonia plasticadhaerens]|uniref:Uncharacterized protein n=1 Tax=Tautonia plasticadhaerens TaxID=2527974 RepID=A0A518H367_9BACT|nr:hypothetical protein [Tautonia plasticadhaerens]QDV35285.1 hypothetical protein ElP_31880 [Tautonia plasticadhaerens]
MAQVTTVEGTYRNGVVELSERPTGVTESARVLVTFLDEATVERDPRAAMRKAAFAEMEAGIDLGGPPYPSRDELHDRRR